LRVEGFSLGIPFRDGDSGRWSLRFGGPLNDTLRDLSRRFLRFGSSLVDIDVFSDGGGVDIRNKEERGEGQKDRQPNGENHGFD
jgi:hypothetical protein